MIRVCKPLEAPPPFPDAFLQASRLPDMNHLSRFCQRKRVHELCSPIAKRMSSTFSL